MVGMAGGGLWRAGPGLGTDVLAFRNGSLLGQAE